MSANNAGATSAKLGSEVTRQENGKAAGIEPEVEVEAKAGPSTEDTGQDTAEGSERKERKVRNVWAVPFYRKSVKNKLLLAVVMEQDPFLAPLGQLEVSLQKW